MQIKVVLLSANYPDPINNWAPWNQEANIAISRIPGVSAEIVAPRPYSLPIRGLPGADFSRIPERMEGTEGTIHYPRFVYPVPKKWFYPLAGSSYSLSIGRYVLRNIQKPDLVHSHHIFPDGYGILNYCRKMNVPLVVDIHGDTFFSEWWTSSLKSRIQRVLDYSSKIVCISRHILDQTLEIGIPEGKLVYVPLGVDSSRFQTDIIDDEDIEPLRKQLEGKRGILFVGGLIQRKGPSYLIKAISLLERDLLANTKFVVVGDGPLLQELKEMAASLQVSDLVIFTGRISSNQLNWLYRYCDIFVLPSLSEGKPTVINEAMASGCAIIASDVSGIPEQVNDGVNGYLVQPGDSEKIAEYLRILLSDDAFLEKMKNESIRKIEDDGITWERYGERIGKIYSEIMEK